VEETFSMRTSFVLLKEGEPNPRLSPAFLIRRFRMMTFVP